MAADEVSRPEVVEPCADCEGEAAKPTRAADNCARFRKSLEVEDMAAFFLLNVNF